MLNYITHFYLSLFVYLDGKFNTNLIIVRRHGHTDI